MGVNAQGSSDKFLQIAVISEYVSKFGLDPLSDLEIRRRKRKKERKTAVKCRPFGIAMPRGLIIPMYCYSNELLFSIKFIVSKSPLDAVVVKTNPPPVFILTQIIDVMIVERCTITLTSTMSLLARRVAVGFAEYAERRVSLICQTFNDRYLLRLHVDRWCSSCTDFISG